MITDKLNAHIAATEAADAKRLLEAAQHNQHIDLRDARRHAELNSRPHSRTHARQQDDDVTSISSRVSSKKQTTFNNPAFELRQPPTPTPWLPSPAGRRDVTEGGPFLPTPHVRNSVYPPPPPLNLSDFEAIPNYSQGTPPPRHHNRSTPNRGKRKSVSRSPPLFPPG